MNRRNQKRILIALITSVLIAGIFWGIQLFQREKDPRWQAAKEIDNVQSALQRIVDNAQLASLTEVRSYEITRHNNPSIYYYCTITSYLSEEYSENSGLNKEALSAVIDVDSLENRHDCKVGDWEAVMGEKDGLHYLCWTYSPKYSCVFEYAEGSVSEEDLLRMAESVTLSKQKEN